MPSIVMANTVLTVFLGSNSQHASLLRPHPSTVLMISVI